METTLTLNTTPDQRHWLATLDAPMNEGQSLSITLRVPLNLTASVNEVQTELIDNAIAVLSLIKAKSSTR